MVNEKMKEMRILSSDGIHELHGFLAEPKGEIKGLVQIVHGMTDYTLRYAHFMEKLAENGYLAFGYDQLGHGYTAASPEELGFIAPKDGWKYLVRDVSLFYEAVRGRYGDAPYALLGHSMGSFVARLAALEKNSPKKLILVGSGEGDAASPLGRMMAKGMELLYGQKHVSHWMYGLVFSDYDKRFEGDWPNRWVTVDTENLIRYKDDPFCTFRFSVSALRDLITLNEKSNSRRFYRDLPLGCSSLFLSGSEDPVGNYGKGVQRIGKRLEKYGKKNRVILYQGFRHEILQDFCRDQVISDILSFLEE